MDIVSRVLARYKTALGVEASVLPKILKMVFAAVFLGPSKHLTEAYIKGYDWVDTAEDLFDEGEFKGSAEDLAKAIATKFYKDTDSWMGPGSFYDIIEANETVGYLQKRLEAGVHSGEPTDVQISANSEIEIRFEVWGEIADDDNPDEKANFDNDIDDQVTAITGPMRVTHTFERNMWDSHSFVHKYSGKWKADIAGLLKANMGKAVEAEAREAASKHAFQT